ncbi:GapA-binding peptide SR1P [Bacillus sp. JJ1532]
MGTIVCQACNSTIDYFEDEKVTVLYSKADCSCCEGSHHQEEI